MAVATISIQQQVLNFQNEMYAGNKAKEDMALQLGPFMNMESQLSVAPLCLALMGQLCLLATNRDFSLTDGVERLPEYEYLTHPGSFRASISQVSHEGFWAFNEAHSAMYEIKLYSGQVKGKLGVALRILYEGTPRQVEIHLPIALNAITEIANSCTSLANGVVEKYSRVKLVIQELQKAALAKQGKTEKLREMTEFQAQLAQSEKEALDQEQNKVEARFQKLEQEVNEMTEQYKDALDDMPGTWDMIGLHAVETIGMVATLGISALVNKNGETSTSPINSTSSDETQTAAPGNEDLVLAIKSLFGIVQGMSSFVRDDGTIDVLAVEGKDPSTTSAEQVKVSLQRKLDDITAALSKGASTLVGNKSVELVNKLDMFCVDISKAAIEGNRATEEIQGSNDGNITEAFGDQFKNLVNTADNLANADCPALLNALPYNKNGMDMANVRVPGGNNGLAQSRLRSAHLKLETTRAQLVETQRRADQAFDRELEVTRKIQETIQEIARFDAESASYAEILQILDKGLKAFGALEEKWAKLMRFFESMASLINVSLGQPLKDFVDHSRGVQEERTQGFSLDAFSRELVYKPAYEAAKVAYLVQHLASSYHQISQQHLMPLVSRMGVLISLNKDTDRDRILEEKNAITAQAKEIEDDIIEIIRENKAAYESKMEARVNEIEVTFNKHVPALPPQQKIEVQAVALNAVTTDYSNFS